MNFEKIEKVKLNIKNLIYSQINTFASLEAATIVGSFTEKGELDFNDIDIVIILKNLNKKNFDLIICSNKKKLILIKKK